MNKEEIIAAVIQKVGNPNVFSDIIDGEVIPPRIALPPTANSERVRPEDMPTDPATFQRWGGYACVEWPKELMARAYNAHVMQTCYYHVGAIEMFRRDYEAWWLLSETEKEMLMNHDQRVSDRRQMYRREASEVAMRASATLRIAR